MCRFGSSDVSFLFFFCIQIGEKTSMRIDEWKSSTELCSSVCGMILENSRKRPSPKKIDFDFSSIELRLKHMFHWYPYMLCLITRMGFDWHPPIVVRNHNFLYNGHQNVRIYGRDGHKIQSKCAFNGFCLNLAIVCYRCVVSSFSLTQSLIHSWSKCGTYFL